MKKGATRGDGQSTPSKGQKPKRGIREWTFDSAVIPHSIRTPKCLDAAAVDRILAHARVRIAPENSLAFQRDLDATAAGFVTQVYFGKLPSSEKQALRLRQIGKAAHRLLKALGCGQTENLPPLALRRLGGAIAWSPKKPLVWQNTPESDARLAEAVAGIRTILGSAQAACDYIDKHETWPGRIVLSKGDRKAISVDRTLQMFVVRLLSNYQDYTGRKASIGIVQGEVSGPTIRFIEAVFEELRQAIVLSEADQKSNFRFMLNTPSAETLRNWVDSFRRDNPLRVKRHGHISA